MKQKRFNSWRRLFALSLFSLALLALLTFSLARPSAAHASGGGGGGSTPCSDCSITIADSGQLIAKTTVVITTTVTCTIPAGALFPGSGFDIQIAQTFGKDVAQGFGSGSITTCDGTPQTFQVAVTPPAGSIRFHNGSAVVTGTVFVNYEDPSSGNFVEESASVGPQIINI